MKKTDNKRYLCPDCKKEWTNNEWADTEWFDTVYELKDDECEKRNPTKYERVKKTPYPEMVPDSIIEERKKYVKSTIQSHRQGQLSKEFVQNYPKKTKEFLDAGVITQKEIDGARNVWQDIPNIQNIKKTL